MVIFVCIAALLILFFSALPLKIPSGFISHKIAQIVGQNVSVALQEARLWLGGWLECRDIRLEVPLSQSPLLVAVDRLFVSFESFWHAAHLTVRGFTLQDVNVTWGNYSFRVPSCTVVFLADQSISIAGRVKYKELISDVTFLINGVGEVLKKLETQTSTPGPWAEIISRLLPSLWVSGALRIGVDMNAEREGFIRAWVKGELDELRVGDWVINRATWNSPFVLEIPGWRRWPGNVRLYGQGTVAQVCGPGVSLDRVVIFLGDKGAEEGGNQIRLVLTAESCEGKAGWRALGPKLVLERPNFEEHGLDWEIAAGELRFGPIRYEQMFASGHARLGAGTREVKVEGATCGFVYDKVIRATVGFEVVRNNSELGGTKTKDGVADSCSSRGAGRSVLGGIKIQTLLGMPDEILVEGDVQFVIKDGRLMVEKATITSSDRTLISGSATFEGNTVRVTLRGVIGPDDLTRLGGAGLNTLAQRERFGIEGLIELERGSVVIKDLERFVGRVGSNSDLISDIIRDVEIECEVRGVDVLYRGTHFTEVRAVGELKDAVLIVKQFSLCGLWGFAELTYKLDLASKVFEWVVYNSEFQPSCVIYAIYPELSQYLPLFSFNRKVRVLGQIWGQYENDEATVADLVIETAGLTFKGVQVEHTTVDITYRDKVLTIIQAEIRKAELKALAKGVVVDLRSTDLSVDFVDVLWDSRELLRAVSSDWLPIPEKIQQVLPVWMRVSGSSVEKGEGGIFLHIIAKGAQYERAVLDWLEVVLVWGNGSVRVDSLKAGCAGGQVEGAAEIGWDAGQETGFWMGISFTNLDLATLGNCVGKPDTRINGRLGGAAFLRGPTFLEPHFWKGVGEIRINKASLWQVPVFSTLSQIFQAVLPGLGKLEAPAVQGSFELEHGRFMTSDLTISGLPVLMRLSGQCDLEGLIALNGELELLGNIPIVGSINRFFILPVTGTLRFKVEGTIGSPEIRLTGISGALRPLSRILEALGGGRISITDKH